MGRGLCDLARLDEIHRRMSDQLSDHAVQLDGIYVCPHRPDDGCVCRKPRTGLVEAAAADLHFAAEDSFVVGDSASDIALGRALGATTFLVRTGHGRAALASGCEADHVVDDLAAAAAVIVGLVPKRP